VIDTSNTNTSVGRGDITMTDTGIIGPSVGGHDDIIETDTEFCYQYRLR
jgi:hypothetical protein